MAETGPDLMIGRSLPHPKGQKRIADSTKLGKGRIGLTESLSKAGKGCQS